MSKRRKLNSRRNRRLRLRFFDAGNTKCPICLSEFTRTDVEAGKVTLEHAPPEALNGSPICLTCNRCNNNASLIDHHAFMSMKAREEWSAGDGARIVVNLFGFKKSHRFIPSDPNAPLPIRKHLLRNGKIDLGPLPPKTHLDRERGLSFRIPQRDDYEFISMIKSAYLLVFSLMGKNGYHFAENKALESVREQIMDPAKKLLNGEFVVTGTMEQSFPTPKNLIHLYVVRPSCWMIPLWNNKVVVLLCGGSEPIDKFTFPEEASSGSLSIPSELLPFWASCRFDSSASISGSVSEDSEVEDGALVGRIDRSPSITSSGGKWHWMVVYHHDQRYVAFPCAYDGEKQDSGIVTGVEMLNENLVVGRGMDKSTLASVSQDAVSNEITIHAISREVEQKPDGGKDP